MPSKLYILEGVITLKELQHRGLGDLGYRAFVWEEFQYIDSPYGHGSYVNTPKSLNFLQKSVYGL
jgi:hypothetical protein